MAEKNREQKRVMLWAPPRSLSTAFERCISVLNEYMNVDITHEIYTAACHLGPNRHIKIPTLFEPIVYEPKLSYKRVKSRLEAEHHGKDLVFCKELGYSIHGKFDMMPEGYKHTFLIRHPAKVFMSFRTFLKKFPNKLLRLSLRDILPKGLVYKELFDLFEHTTNTLGQKPIIVDADDLIENPEEMLRVYCKAIGIPYHQGMAKWRRSKDDLKAWHYSKRLMFVNKVMGQYDRAFSTPGLMQPTTKKDIDVNSLPLKVRELVEYSLPYYEQMYTCRLTPDTFNDNSATHHAPTVQMAPPSSETAAAESAAQQLSRTTCTEQIVSNC